MVEGIVPTRLRDGDREHDIRVRLAPEFRNDTAAILRTPLYSPSGAAVRAGDVVDFAPAVGPSNIDREQRRRQAKIGVDLAEGYALGDVTAEVEKAMAGVQMPANFEWGFAGDVEMMQESAAAMGLALILAVAFIYIVLASQFESFLEPFIIMLSLPLAIVGALLLLLATGNNIGMPAMIGVVMLMGLVTKNAILLVDYTNHLRRERAARQGCAAQGGTGAAPADRHDDGGDDPRHDAVGVRRRRWQRVPRADLHRDDWRPDHLDAADARRGAGRLPAARGRRRALQGVAAGAAAGRASRAARVTRALIVLALVGAFVGVASVFATMRRPRAGFRASMHPRRGGPGGIRGRHEHVTDHRPGARARHDAERGAQGNAASSCASARRPWPRRSAAFLPSVNLNFLYTPAQASPLLRIPAGVFGPSEQTFRANFTRENIVAFDVSQPLYTGGRLSTRMARRPPTQEASRLDVERARQALTLRVYETFYAALDERPGRPRRPKKVCRSRSGIWSWRRRASRRARRRGSTSCAPKWSWPTRAPSLIRARSAAEVSYQALRTVLSLPQNEPLQLAGTLDEVPTLPARVDAPERDPRPRRHPRDRPAARGGGAPRVAGQCRAETDGRLPRQLPVPGGRRSTSCSTASTAATSSGWRCSVPALQRADRRRPAQRRVTARVRQAEHGANAALDGARLELASASTELDAAREIVSTQQKAVELAREGLPSPKSPTRTASSPPPSSTMRGSRCSKRSGS